jgi:hypothetical protein
MFLILSNSAFASKRHHHAHVHGEAKLNIALESANKGSVEFVSPAEGVFGFEHTAKSEREKKKVQESLALLSKPETFIIFDSKGECTWGTPHVEQESGDGGHSDVKAHYSFDCKNSLEGSELKIDFSKFSRIKKLEIVVLKDEAQSRVELKKAKGAVKL